MILVLFSLWEKTWANLRLSKYSLPRCHVSLGLPYDFGDSNFLPRPQGAGKLPIGKPSNDARVVQFPRYAPSCERTGQCTSQGFDRVRCSMFEV